MSRVAVCIIACLFAAVISEADVPNGQTERTEYTLKTPRKSDPVLGGPSDDDDDDR